MEAVLQRLLAGQEGGSGGKMAAVIAAVLVPCLLMFLAVPGMAGGANANASALAAIAEQEYERNGGVEGCGSDYWGYWGKGTEMWCADFVYYCGDLLGYVGTEEGQPMGAYTASCYWAWKNMEARGAYLFSVYEDTPLPGDIVFYYFTQGGAARDISNMTSLCHIGIVAAFDPQTQALTTVEGNVGNLGSARNYVGRPTYTDIYGQTWEGAAIWGFARLFPAVPGATDGAVEMLKAFEGWTPYPRWDYSQWTVGYGTRCPDDKLAEYRSRGITREEAEQLLLAHMETAYSAVNTWAAGQGLILTQYQLDALVSLTFNLGPGWLDSGYSGLKEAIRNGTGGRQLVQLFADISHAGGRVLPGLVERRICEAYLYLTGQYVTDYRATGYTYAISGGTVTIDGGMSS